MKLVHVETAPTYGPPARPEPGLSLVPASTASERARQLLQDARIAAIEHLEALKASIGETHALSEAVVRGGDLYTVGLQDLARRLTEDLSWRAKTLEALIERQREAAAPRRRSLQGF
jgi:hypothetical protein